MRDVMIDPKKDTERIIRTVIICGLVVTMRVKEY